jgi:hypothetical protein
MTMKITSITSITYNTETSGRVRFADGTSAGWSISEDWGLQSYFCPRSWNQGYRRVTSKAKRRAIIRAVAQDFYYGA